MITEHPHFFAATILEWKKLLVQDKYKHIIVESLRYLATNNRIFVFGFVVMQPHTCYLANERWDKPFACAARFFKIHLTTNKV
jgi:hypothetical protein